jgi:septation ring formation regulator EzrA
MQLTAQLKPKLVKTKKWGDVYVRSLTVAEIEDQISDTSDQKDKNRFARAAARILCDESGVRLFDPALAGDVALLAAQPWALLKQVLDASDENVEATPTGK